MYIHILYIYKLWITYQIQREKLQNCWTLYRRMQRSVQLTFHYDWFPQQCGSFFVWWDWWLVIARRTVLYTHTRHTTQGVKWDPWLEEMKTFPKEKVTEQIKCFKPRFSFVYVNQLIDYSKCQLTGFCRVEILELKNVINTKSAAWFLIDFFIKC